jgi:hypothetical protein
LFHEFSVDTEQRARQAFGQEALFNFDGFDDDVLNGLFAWTFAEVGEEQTSKIRMKTLIPGDEFVGEGQARHKPALLKPEDGCERSREKYAFNSGKSNKAFSESRILISDPT